VLARVVNGVAVLQAGRGVGWSLSNTSNELSGVSKMSLPSHIRDVVTAELAGKRLFPDVSVLLAGVLDSESASSDVFTCATGATIVLSAHVEETAVAVLRGGAPNLVAEFNDGLLRLSVDRTVERIPRQPDVLPTNETRKLNNEDRQVLADAIGGRADVLLTHDSQLFEAVPQSLRARSPSSVAWSPLDAANIQRGTDASTFVGFFYPEWSSDAVSGTMDQFFFFEVSDYVRAFYNARKRTAVLEWNTPAGSRGSIRMPLHVEANSYHFVAAVLQTRSILLYIDGVTRERKHHIGEPNLSATFHPFMSAQSTGQICGACHFRVEPRALSVRELHRLRASQSTRLSDGERKWSEARPKLRLVATPQDEGFR